MVFEGRIAEMLQNQASRFLRGFSADQLKLGFLSGRLELVGLALNAEPLDSLLLESEVPLVMKAGVLSSAVTQIALLQGELELVIDGLLLVLGPACRWLTKTEVFSHRLNEIQRLEFVHMRSQCQRRTLEREMFRQLFSDYLSRLKISVKNVHIRVEVEGEVDSSPGGRNLHAGFGIILGSCDITPVKGVVKPPDKDKDPSSSELLLAESVEVKGLSLYHEPPERARVLVPWSLYHSTRNRPLGVFDDLKQENFVALIDDCRRQHAQVPIADQLMPPASFVVGIDLRSQPVRDGFHVDSCLTMEITVKLAEPSRIHFSTLVLEHLQWFVRRTLDFQLWQFLHPVRDPPERSRERWRMIRSFIALKRRIHGNNYSLSEAIMMRIHCKEYVRLYKKKFNGQSSVVQWRKSLPALTHLDAVKLSDIELVYPADKLVNFRLMAHAELKTEMALNSFLNSDDGQSTGGQYRRAARELTPLEQLHLHGQHGYGVNIYRGLPPPPSSLKIRIDIQASRGLWWTCRLNETAVQPGAKGPPKSADLESCWTVALDCAAQPIRVLLVDSIVDASVFATIEVPRAPAGQRPLAVLLGRTASAFLTGSPGRDRNAASANFGGKGSQEWCSVLELDGPVYCCSQLKTVLTSSPNSPWDVFFHFSCGDSLDMSAGVNAMDSFGSQQPQRVHTGLAGTGGDKDACIRVRVPLTLASGQAGPLVNFLKQCLTSLRNTARQEVRVGPSHSTLAWFVRRVGSANDIAVFRLHARVPPVLIEGSLTGGQSLWLPRFDGACHLEHGGLIDGFVVGLHHLRHFAAFVSSTASSFPIYDQSVCRSNTRTGGTPWPLLPLEQSPSCTLLFAALAAAFAAAMGSQSQAGGLQGDAALLALLRRTDLAGIIRKNDGLTDPESPASAVSLLLIVLAVMVSRRVLWNERDSRPGGPDLSAVNAEANSTVMQAVSEVHWLVGGMMRALLVMGFPLHPRCLPLAAWLGALEVLQVAPSPLQPSSLVTWAARGAYANLQSRQEEVIRWLLRQRAQIDEVDKDGRSLLDWACWGGAEGLAGIGMRAGLLHASSNGGRSPLASPKVAGSPASFPLLPPPSPLTLAVAGRSPHIVSMLLRATSDPHAPPRNSGCGPLLLAVRMCEYDLGCQVLSETPFVSVDAALGPTLNGIQNGASVAKGDYAGESSSMGGCNVRATVALIDSLRRFAGSLSRRNAEDYGTNVATSTARSHLPGPHPDEGLYATGQLPFNDILHPLAVQLPLPLHKVGHEFRPHPPPHRWLRRGTVNPWSRAQRFIECCIRHDFRPDAAVMTRALPHLPNEARNIVQQLFGGGQCLTEVSIDGSPNGSTPWFGAVLGNDGRERGESPNVAFFTGSPARSEYTPERNELSAAISFAKEIRELRTRSPSEGVPPLDIAAALGADGQGGRRPLSHQTHRLQASPGPPTMWITVSLGGSSPSAGPVCLDAICVQSGCLTLKLRDASGRMFDALRMQEIAAIRQFQLSGFEGPEMKHIVEIRLRPEADAMPLVEMLLESTGETHMVNGLRTGSTHLVNLVFLRSEDGEQFAAIIQSNLQTLETRGMDEQDDGLNLQGGSPWEPTQLRSCVLRGAEYLNRMAAEAKEATPLPKVRVAVIGAPRVGKTRVAACIVNELAGVNNEGLPQEGDSGPAWLRISSGRWPVGGSARAEVHVWDGSAASLPGQLERTVVDPSVPLLLVTVLDAGLIGFGCPADALAGACIAEASSTSSSSVAPRRALVVENVFTGALPGAPALSRGEAGQNVLRCSLRDARSITELRRTFSSMMAEIVEQTEARLRSSRRPTAPPLPHGRGDWSAVVSSRSSLPPPSADLGIDGVLSSRIRGDSVLLDPSLVSWAWATIWASHGCLAEGLGAANCGGVVVPWERLERILATVDLDRGSSEGSRSEVALILMRALTDVGIVCPIPVSTAFVESGIGFGSQWVLIPDFGRRIQLVSPASLRIACGEAVGAGDTLEVTPGSRGTYMSARLMWDAPGSPPPSLRTYLRNFLARAAVGTPERTFEMRRFVLLEVGPSGATRPVVAGDSLAPGFLLAFDLVSTMATRQSEGDVTIGSTGSVAKAPLSSVREATPSGHITHSARSTNNGVAPNHSDDDLATGTSSGSGYSNGSRLTAILVGVSYGWEGKKSSEKPFWDLRCAGPHAQWACRMFLGSGANGPSFTGFRHRKVRNSSSSTSVGGSSSSSSSAWPFTPPTCVLSHTDEGADSSPEFGNFAWLFHRSLAIGRMRSASTGEDDDPCACCAALCGKSDEGGFAAASSSSSCSNLEAALLSRNWWEAQRCLDEALASGWEAWSCCAASMARLAHEFAAAVGGPEARALPLLAEAGNGMGGSSRAIALVPEESLPLAVGTKLRPPGTALGQIRSSPGVEVWLRLCRPIALWSAAGASRGFSPASRELLTSNGSGGGRIGEQVSEALKVAMSVNITAEMVVEVWDALKQLDSSRHLFRRAVGTWIQIEEAGGFLL